MNNITKKPVVIISGGTGYLGSALAKEFSSRDWQVALLSRTKNEQNGYQTFVCDITDEKAVRDTVSMIVETLGEVRACIHAASTKLSRNSLLEEEPDAFAHTLDVSLNGCFNLAKYAGQYMKEGASFVGITTEALEDSGRGKMGAYPFAKYALRGLLRFLTAEFAGKGIKVYAVAPGFLPGGLNSDLPAQVIEFLKKKDQHMQSPEQVTALVVDICTENAAVPSGSSVRVRGREVTPL